jgi:hypothetical protein
MVMASEPASVAKSHGRKRGKKYFTLAEANRAVGYVSRIMTDACACYRQAVATRERMEHPRPGDESDEVRGCYEKAMDHLNELVDELHQVGVELKDFEMGLVDFPALHQGREVYLCWRLGEAKIVGWHELDAGFAGRQDVGLLEQV